MSDNAFIHKEGFRILATGDPIGSGIGRQVFACGLNAEWVIKVEEGSGSFQNAAEWFVWDRVKDVKHVARWFAPCHYISPCGGVLIQSRTQPLPKEQYPDKVPVFLSDLKYSNYGLLNGQFVCHDYGTHLMLEHGMTRRMKRADWWEHS